MQAKQPYSNTVCGDTTSIASLHEVKFVFTKRQYTNLNTHEIMRKGMPLT